MRIELRTAMTVGLDPKSTPRLSMMGDDYSVFIDGRNHGYLYVEKNGWVLALGLPGHDIEFGPVVLMTKEEALEKVAAVAPGLVGIAAMQESGGGPHL